MLTGRPKRWPVAAGGQTFFTLVSQGTIATWTLGWAANCWVSAWSARTRAGVLMPTAFAKVSQRPAAPWLPGGSLMHIEPDWSTSSTTFTGKPLGSGGSVHTRPRRERWSSRALIWAAFFSSEVLLQEHNTTASTRLAVVKNSGDFEFTFLFDFRDEG